MPRKQLTVTAGRCRPSLLICIGWAEMYRKKQNQKEAALWTSLFLTGQPIQKKELLFIPVNVSVVMVQMDRDKKMPKVQVIHILLYGEMIVIIPQLVYSE